MVNAYLSRRSCVLATIIVAAASSASTLSAQAIERVNVAANTAATGRVRGIVFDSLLLKPLARASVWVAGGTQSTLTDSLGRFDLGDVPAGTQTIAFSSASLDSLGLPANAKSITVVADGMQQLTLNTPSFRSVWRALCGSTIATKADSGIVWGTVRDAVTLTLQSGAAARFSWLDTHVNKDKEVSLEQKGRDVRTDSTGTYYVCGLPADLRISSEGAGTKSATGALEYMIGARRLLRADLLVSTEMVRAPSDSARRASDKTWIGFRGSAILVGKLRDEHGNAVVGAVVTVSSMDTTVRSDDNGAFTIGNVPAGTQLLEVRQIGFAPVASLVDMRPAATTTAQFDLNRTNELKPVEIKANRVRPIDRIGYEERKRAGFGYYLEYNQFKNVFHPGAIVQALPNVTVAKTSRGTIITMKNGIKTCTPTVFIDGYRASIDDAAVRSVDAYRAVEVYNRAINTPPQYASGDCGVILFWTWYARW